MGDTRLFGVCPDLGEITVEVAEMEMSVAVETGATSR